MILRPTKPFATELGQARAATAEGSRSKSRRLRSTSEQKPGLGGSFCIPSALLYPEFSTKITGFGLGYYRHAAMFRSVKKITVPDRLTFLSFFWMLGWLASSHPREKIRGGRNDSNVASLL